MEPTLAAVAVVSGSAALAGPMASRYVQQARLAQLCARRRALVLTYDDGPGERTTPRVLKALAAGGAKATFFALGRQAERRPTILDDAVRAGHEVGCHSYGHLHPWKSAPWSAARDVSRGFRALSPWTSGAPLYRPPYGKLTASTWFAARSRGARFAWWTLDSGDTWETMPAPQTIVDSVRRAAGGVVLMHDLDRGADREGFVLDLTAGLLRAASQDGLRVVTHGALLAEESAA